MDSIISRIPEREFTPLLVAFTTSMIFCGFLLLGMVMFYLYKTRRNERDAALKMEMIARGFGAEQICQVIAARSSDDGAVDRLNAATGGSK